MKSQKSLSTKILLLLLLLLLSLPSNASSAQVTLEWEHSTDYSVVGYKVYWGTSSGLYTESEDVGYVNYTTLYGLDDDTTYYFAATAYDADGNESGYSEEVNTLSSSSSGSGSSSGGGGGGGGCAMNPQADFGLEWLILFSLTMLLYKRRAHFSCEKNHCAVLASPSPTEKNGS